MTYIFTTIQNMDLLSMRIYKYGKIRKLQCVFNVYESYFNRADILYKVTADN